MDAIKYRLKTEALHGLEEEITVAVRAQDQSNRAYTLTRTVVLRAEILSHSAESAELIALYERLRQKIWQSSDDHLPASREIGCHTDSGRSFYGISGFDRETGDLVLFNYGWAGGGPNRAEKYCRLPYYYSHFLGVDDRVRIEIRGKPFTINYRYGGIGSRVKAFIDRIVSREGLFANVWTVNPLLAANASMNFSKYGGRVLLFDPNHYGVMSGRNRNLRTDRFVMIKPVDHQVPELSDQDLERIIKEWLIAEEKKSSDKHPSRILFSDTQSGNHPVRREPSMEERSRAKKLLAEIREDIDCEDRNHVALVSDICELPLSRDEDWLLMEIPADFDALYESDPHRTRRIQVLSAIILNRYVKELNYGVQFCSIKRPAVSGTGIRTYRNYYIFRRGQALCRYCDLPWQIS